MKNQGSSSEGGGVLLRFLGILLAWGRLGESQGGGYRTKSCQVVADSKLAAWKANKDENK